MSQFNENDIDTIRSGVLGAIAYVSQAEPGFFATFKESMAASKVLQNAPEDFRRVMTGGLVMPPQAGNKDEMNQRLVENLNTAVQIADRDPETGRALRNYVLTACQEVAQAAKGVSAEESAAIEEIRQVLDQAEASNQGGNQVDPPAVQPGEGTVHPPQG